MKINILFKGCPVNKNTRLSLQNAISQALARRPDEINLLFATTGGEIYEALLFYDFIKNIDYHINIYNIGEVRSAGNVMFLAFERRFFLPKSKFLFHSVRLSEDAEVTEEKLVKSKEFNQSMIKIFEEKLHLPVEYISIMVNSNDDIVISEPDEIESCQIAKISFVKFEANFEEVSCS